MDFSKYSLPIGWKEIAVAAAIPAVSALITYLLLKDESRSSAVLHSNFSRIEVKVRGDKVSAVIGQKGSVVREIERTSGAKVRVRASRPSNGAEEEDGIVVIQGLRDNVLAADIAVRKVIAQTAPTMIENVYVPKSAIGFIIGKGGASIRELAYLSGARVSVGRTGGDSEVLTIRGRPRAIETAKMWLKSKLESFNGLNVRSSKSQRNTKF